MGKKQDLWLDQLREAVEKVRAEPVKTLEYSEFDEGYKAGASMVMCKFFEIQRRDAANAAEGIPRGSV